MANTAADNGVFYAFLSESDCMEVCLTTTSCVALDLGPHGCVLHTDVDDLSTAYTEPGVTQFVLSRQCLPSTVHSTAVEATDFAEFTGIEITDT